MIGYIQIIRSLSSIILYIMVSKESKSLSKDLWTTHELCVCSINSHNISRKRIIFGTYSKIFSIITEFMYSKSSFLISSLNSLCLYSLSFLSSLDFMKCNIIENLSLYFSSTLSAISFIFSAMPSAVVSGTIRVSRYLSLPFIKKDSIAAL